MRIPRNAEQIIHTLEENGYEAYVVGGCVRDMILGRQPGDWDITTSAKPLQVKALFRRTIDTGIQHGTVTVMMGKEGYEVTTYRMDGEYEDHRHPKKVQYTQSLLEDLKRRDFTINAMAYNPRTGLIDEFYGMRDIERCIIRCVGDADERFSEDALRMLRGIRFAGQLQFDIDRDTYQAICNKASTLIHVSAERIQVELTKLLTSKGSDRLLLTTATGLSQYFLPELDAMLATPQHNPHHCYDVGHHTIETIRQVDMLWRESDLGEKEHKMLVYAALLHDVAKPECKSTDDKGIDHFHGHPERGAKKAREIMRRLKFDNETTAMVEKLIRYHDRRHELCQAGDAKNSKGKRQMRRLVHQAGETTMPLLFMLQEADLMAQSDYMRGEKLEKLKIARDCYEEMRRDQEAVKIADLAIGGRELIDMGMKPGRDIGEVLKYLMDQVLEDPSLNTKEALMELAGGWMRRKF